MGPIVVVVKRGVLALVLVGAGFLLGYAAFGQRAHEHMTMETQAPPTETTLWYCSMDPQIIREEPGDCPICGMDLIPMPKDLAVGAASGELVVSEAAVALMDIQTTSVERKFVAKEVRMVGKVAYDETRIKSIAAWVPGRIDRLYVDFTGTSVTKGDHLVYLYSPELVSAQAELLRTLQSTQSASEGTSEFLRTSNESTLAAAREKLRLLGLSTGQIEAIEASGQPLTHLTINAPIGGIVIEKKATEGMYVTTGTPIYTVADLSQVWVLLDAYESDLPWIRYGQPVTFSAEAYPGEVFDGWISFEEPILNDKTRTVKVRVNVSNPDGRLKPGMFVHAAVTSQIAQTGKVMDPNMAGKWVCPMHPSVVKDHPGTCDICGMDLVTTESLGYTTAKASGPPPLVIPATAPLITGKRAVVYVKVSDTEEPTFEGREVVLGPRAGDYYVVTSGLTEGETVVTNGNFKIDSALQIQAKPSMMNPEEMMGSMPPGETHDHSQ